jgi:PAS domain S-box-containing protein
MENIDLLRKEIAYLNDENARLKVEIQTLKQDRNTVRISHEEEAEYQESQVRFRTIFETSKLGNKVISSDLKILQINAAMVGLLGYDHKDEIIGTRILDYAPLEFHAHWLLLQKKLWETNMPSFTLETCLRKKDGTVIWCQVNSILFRDKGEILGYTIIEDITEQHELKRQRENFISIASHELKTPLTSLQAYLQVMYKMIETDTVISDKLIKLSESSKRSISKLSALVGDLLDSTKISKGQLYLNITNFNISELVERSCSHVRSNEKYRITYKGDLNLKISADEQKIDQVLVNLVNNAVKYAPQSKEIVIQVEDFEDKVKISVIDAGKGIAKDKLPFLFDSYYQVSNVEKNTQGLGLGLYISSEIIKRHRGEIGVDSEVGKGSTFWFTIPKNIQNPIHNLIPDIDNT